MRALCHRGERAQDLPAHPDPRAHPRQYQARCPQGPYRVRALQAQEDALDETFARLIEIEVARAVAPWAEEPLDQKREEARWQGFLEFFEALLGDWPGYLEKIESYQSIEAFMREEALERKRELELARSHL